MQYLQEGNWLGFLEAIYVGAFGGNPDVAYGVIVLLFTVPIYIKTKSILLMAILWCLVGGALIVAVPLAANLAILLMGLGIGGVLWKLFIARHE